MPRKQTFALQSKLEPRNGAFGRAELIFHFSSSEFRVPDQGLPSCPSHDASIIDASGATLDVVRCIGERGQQEFVGCLPGMIFSLHWRERTTGSREQDLLDVCPGRVY